MTGDARETWPRGGERNWLWEAYAVAINSAAVIAVVLLSDRYPGRTALAVAALVAMAVLILATGRRVTGFPERDWRTWIFVACVVGLWVIALLSSAVSVVAIPALFPLVFSTLPLRAALAVTTIVSLLPLTVLLVDNGFRTPNLAVAVAITLAGLVTALVIGTVIVTSIRQRRQLALLVAELAATRAESARLSRESGTAAERQRLAREIHDTLAQGFTSIVMLAQAVEPELDTDTAAAKRHIELIGATARENLAEARAMVAELTPSPLEEPLPAAIQRQCDRLAAETDAVVTTRIDADLPTQGMASDVVLLRAAQEAFANIRKHAHASAVTVELMSSDSGVRLAVEDDGVGRGDRQPEGFGLRGMRTRVAQVGGTMTLSSTAGGGTRLTVEVPS